MITSTGFPVAPPNRPRLVHWADANPPFCLAAAASVAAVLFVAAPARGTTITFTESGTSIIGTPLTVSALIEAGSNAGSANALRITLTNFGAPSRAPADILSSFYFNLADPNTGVRPQLTYVSGSGQAYQVRSGTTDVNVSWTPQTWTTGTVAGASAASNLVAINNYDEGWQFKTLSPPPAFPGLGFGIGTVGNSDIWKFIPGGTSGNPEGFDGLVVRGVAPSSMINLGIYSTGTGTDIDPVGTLNGARVVRSQAVFLFTSGTQDLNSVTQSWVQGNVTFGFGTAPDSVLLPEPSSQLLAGLAGLSALGTLVLRMRRPRAADRGR